MKLFRRYLSGAFTAWGIAIAVRSALWQDSWGLIAGCFMVGVAAIFVEDQA